MLLSRNSLLLRLLRGKSQKALISSNWTGVDRNVQDSPRNASLIRHKNARVTIASLAQSPPGRENLRLRILRQVVPLDRTEKVVGPVRNDVAMEHSGDVSLVFVDYGVCPRLPKRLDDS